MVDIDHSIVYRRLNGESGSGTVVHFSANFLVFEIYDTKQEIQLNEVLGNIRITLGQVLFYDGKGVVCEIADSSSIQLVSVFLHDSCIAVGGTESECENEMAFERFLQMHLHRISLPVEVERKLYEFSGFLGQLLAGMRAIQLHANTFARSGISENEFQKVRLRTIEIGLEKLIEQYCGLHKQLANCSEEEKTQIGNFFKRHIFPLSINSRVFRHFHSIKRSPYINLSTMNHLKNEIHSRRVNMRGVMLDELFRRCAGFSNIEERVTHWINDIQQRLGDENGSIHLLFLGSDQSVRLLLQTLDAESLSRLKIDIFCTEDEPVEQYEEQTKEMMSNSASLGSIRYLRASVFRLLQLYFNRKSGDFLKYDRIYSTSFLESLSSKTAAYVIALCLRLINDGGSLSFFSSQASYSSIREHWLLWYDHSLDLNDWKPYLPFETSCTQTDNPCGQLTVCSSPY